MNDNEHRLQEDVCGEAFVVSLKQWIISYIPNQLMASYCLQQIDAAKHNADTLKTIKRNIENIQN